MREHDNSRRHPEPTGSFWKSRANLVLVAFLAVAGVLLVYEHRIHIFTGNGLLIALLVLCVGMHLFMHRGHGGHGGRGSDGGDR